LHDILKKKKLHAYGVWSMLNCWIVHLLRILTVLFLQQATIGCYDYISNYLGTLPILLITGKNYTNTFLPAEVCVSALVLAFCISL